MKAFARAAPWLSRLALAAAAFVLAMIARKFIADPVGAAAASKMSLGSALAVTNMRASFGAFPLGCALVAAGALTARRRHLAGLATVTAVIGAALAVRVYGVLLDGTFHESRMVLAAEAGLLILALVAIAAELKGREQ